MKHLDYELFKEIVGDVPSAEFELADSVYRVLGYRDDYFCKLWYANRENGLVRELAGVIDRMLAYIEMGQHVITND